MGDRESVEVLIVAYNCRALLEDCLGSLVIHTPPSGDLGVAVLDNSSSDGTIKMVRTRFPHVRLTESDVNLGFGRANNELVRSSSADYVMLLNPDTVLRADAVTPMLDCIRDDPRVIAVGPRLIFPDGRRQASNRRLPTLREEVVSLGESVLRGGAPWSDRHLARSLDAREPEEVEFLWATCWLMRRADAQESGPFNEAFPMYDEDTDFCARMRATGRTLVYQPRAEIIHIGGGTANAAVRGELMRTAREGYYRTWRGEGAARAYRAFVTVVSFIGRVARREWRTP